MLTVQILVIEVNETKTIENLSGDNWGELTFLARNLEFKQNHFYIFTVNTWHHSFERNDAIFFVINNRIVCERTKNRTSIRRKELFL
jgi:hypothetical protein